MPTNPPAPANEPAPARPRPLLAAVGWCALALAGPVAMYAHFDWIKSYRPGGVRVTFDTFDPVCYFLSSRWTAGEGTLYGDIASEYPLGANLVFAAVRVAADRLAPFPKGFDGFAWTWMSAAWVVYVGALRRLAAEVRWPVLLLWANPAVLYFVLYRFDIYPTVLTLLALLAARRDRHLAAAGWAGLAVALKGYALFCVPALVAFVWRRAGFGRAAAAGALCAAPLAVGNAAVWAYAGYDGMAGPYRFHAARGLDTSVSTYDVLTDSFGWADARRVVENRRLVTAVQLLAALAVAAPLLARRREGLFAALIDAGTVALVVLTSLSLFYSPQFVLWVLPFVSLSGSRTRLLVAGLYVAASWVLFPLAFDLRIASDYQEWCARLFLRAALAVTAFRLALGALALARLVRPGRAPDAPAGR